MVSHTLKMSALTQLHKGSAQCSLLQARPAAGTAQHPKQAAGHLVATSPCSSSPRSRSAYGSSSRVSRQGRQASVACEAVKVRSYPRADRH